MVKVEKIVLKIGKKELSLSADEVKELKEALDKMFGDERVYRYYYRGYPWYSSPSVIYTCAGITVGGTYWTTSSSSGNVVLSGSTTDQS